MPFYPLGHKFDDFREKKLSLFELVGFDELRDLVHLVAYFLSVR